MRSLDPDSLDGRDEARVRALVELVEAVVQPWFRAQVRGLERLPAGAALCVGNHNAGLLAPEAFLFGAATYRAHGLDGLPYFLAGDPVVELRPLRALTMPLGAVRARPANALRLLERRARVFVYPGGERESMRAFRDRDRILFGGRRGYVRLALRAGVPIVPVVTAGAHATCVILDDGSRVVERLRLDRLLRVKTFPVTLCLPWGVLVGPALLHLPWPTKILQEILAPISFERVGEEAARDEPYVRACAAQVEAAMQAALTRLAAERAIGIPERGWPHE